MKKILSFFSFLFLLCFVFGCSNFAPKKSSDFQKIATFLDYDGTSFSINTNANVNETIQLYKQALEKQIAYSKTISSLSKRQLQALISTLEYLALSSGIADIKGTGFSSKKIEDFYYNKAFMLVDANSKGFLWNLVGKKNTSLGNFVELLPGEETYFAGEAVINLSSSFEKLKQYSLNSSEAFKLLQPLVTYQLDQLIASSDGVWQFAVMASENYDVILSLPDKDKKIFTFISLVTNSLKNSKDGIIELKNIFNDENNISLFISSIKEVDKETQKTNNRIVFTTNKKYSSLPIKNVKQVKDLASYKSFAKNVSKNSIAYFYNAKNVKNLSALEVQVAKKVLDLSFLHYGQVASLSRTQNGFYFTQKSKLDSSSAFISDISFILAVIMDVIGDDIIKELPKDLLSKITLIGSDEPVKVKNNSQVKAKQDKNKYCQDNLGRLGVLINNYTKKHGKMFKDYHELLKAIPQAKELFACPQDTTKRYIYLGPHNKDGNRKLPVVIDQPLSHKESFNVLYLDGTVECLQLEDCKSFRRMISFLHTKNFYSEEEFILLIRKATALDELWKLE